MKIPGYRHLVEDVLPELKKMVPKLIEQVSYCGFDIKTGLFVDQVTEEYFYIRQNPQDSPVAFTYEEMLQDPTLRKILGYLMMWYNKLVFDRTISFSGNRSIHYTVDFCQEAGYNRLRKCFVIGDKGIDIDSVILASMSIINENTRIPEISRYCISGHKEVS